MPIKAEEIFNRHVWTRRICVAKHVDRDQILRKQVLVRGRERSGRKCQDFMTNTILVWEDRLKGSLPCMAMKPIVGLHDLAILHAYPDQYQHPQEKTIVFAQRSTS